jgi:hypothetical protein
MLSPQRSIHRLMIIVMSAPAKGTLFLISIGYLLPSVIPRRNDLYHPASKKLTILQDSRIGRVKRHA